MLPTNAIGTFDFRVTAMAEDGTARSTTHTYEVRLPDASVEDILESVAVFLQGLIDADPGSDLADKLEDVVAAIAVALDELRRDPPDNQAAAGVIEGAVGDLEAAVEAGLFADPATGLEQTDRLVTAARLLATTAIDVAIEAGGEAAKIREAQDSLAAGDAYRADGRLKDAAAAYKNAVSIAEGAAR